MLAAFTFTVEEIFLARKWKLSFCKTLNWKSISASAVSPSAKHLAMVLAHVTIGFVSQTSCKRRIFACTCYLAWCGWGASGSKKQPYLLKGHWQRPRLCKSSPQKYRICQMLVQIIRRTSLSESFFPLNALSFCTKWKSPMLDLWWSLI